MSKELNVKKELWQKAHELESKAFDMGDAVAMGEATEWKGKLALGLFTENQAEPPKKELEIPGFKAGNGVSGSLGEMGPLSSVGVREDGKQ